MTPAQVLDRAGLDRLIGALSARGYRVLGPTVRDGAIVYGDLAATCRPPGRLDGPAGGGQVPPGPP